MCRYKNLNFLFVYSLPLEKRSFREYVSILYTDPRLKIYISGSKVRTKNLFNTLYLPCQYEFIAKNIFKRKAEIDIDEITVALREGNNFFQSRPCLSIKIPNILLFFSSYSKV